MFYAILCVIMHSYNLWFQNFRSIVTQNWGGNLQVSHRSVPSVTFNESSVDPVCAEVKYPKTLDGWTIIADHRTCKV